eukprot:gene1925-2257_t
MHTVSQAALGGSGVIIGEYIIPSVMRVIASCPEGTELNRQLNSKLDLTPHQRCLAMLRWAFGVYSQLPGEARQAIPAGPRHPDLRTWVTPDLAGLLCPLAAGLGAAVPTIQLQQLIAAISGAGKAPAGGPSSTTTVTGAPAPAELASLLQEAAQKLLAQQQQQESSSYSLKDVKAVASESQACASCSSSAISSCSRCAQRRLSEVSVGARNGDNGERVADKAAGTFDIRQDPGGCVHDVCGSKGTSCCNDNAQGERCKFSHPLDRPEVLYNSRGLPLRPNEAECSFYVRNGW